MCYIVYIPDKGVVMENFLTVNEVAKYLRVSGMTIYRMVRSDSIPFFRIGEKIIRFDKNIIDRWKTQKPVEK